MAVVLQGTLALAQEPGAGAPPTGDQTVTTTSEQPAPTLAPWRGSQVSYRNTMTVYTLDKGAELTWNPYYAMVFSFQPRWWFGEMFNVKARLDMTQELTNADDTTRRDETQLGDLSLTAGANNFFTIPVVDIQLSADLSLTFPTSKIEQARTLTLGVGPGIRLHRRFDVLKGLALAYSVRFGSQLYRKTTAELATPLIPGCIGTDGGCDSFLNTGLRNIQWELRQGLVAQLQVTDWLSVGGTYGLIVGWLYPLGKSDTSVSLEPEKGTNQRYASIFEVEAAFSVMPALEIAAGLSTLAPQLAPDSTYYNPLFNRYTTVFFDLRLNVEGLIDQINGDVGRGRQR